MAKFVLNRVQFDLMENGEPVIVEYTPSDKAGWKFDVKITRPGQALKLVTTIRANSNPSATNARALALKFK